MAAELNLKNLASNHTTGILLTMVISSDTKYENFLKEICSFVCNLNLKQAQLKCFQNPPEFVIRTCPEKIFKNTQKAEFQSRTL